MILMEEEREDGGRRRLESDLGLFAQIKSAILRAYEIQARA